MKLSTGTTYQKWTTAHTGKGRFLNRLIPELEKLGVTIVPPGNSADIDLQLGKYVWEPKATKSIIRMGCPHFDDPQPNKRKTAAVKRADAVIYQSNYAKDWCDVLLRKAKKSCVINNGAIPSGCMSKTSGLEPIFVASTRIWTKQKQLKAIVRGFSTVGSGSLLVFGKTNKEYPNHNVTYKGLVSDDELKSYYQVADVIIHLCEKDACPNSVIEAMVCGCRVITNEDAGTKELLTEKDIVIKSAKDLPEAIRAIKPERMYPERLDIKNVAKRYYAFFQEVLSA